jgi:preprotein translocase subunit SecA
MDYLREGVHLRSMAQKDPLVEYRHEGHLMFEELGAEIRGEVVFTLFHAQLEPAEAEQALAVEGNGARADGNLQYEHQSLAGADAIAAAGAGASGGAVATAAMAGGGSTSTQQIVNTERENIGRNDPCWCGSGKKYKKCHGA